MVAELTTMMRQARIPAAAETGIEAQALCPVKAVGVAVGSTAKAGAARPETMELRGRKDGVPDQTRGTTAPGKKISGPRLDQRRGNFILLLSIWPRESDGDVR